MNSPTRHPSAPRKTPPPQSRPLPIPVLVCAACKDPVLPTVRPQPSVLVTIALFFMAVVPALLYLIWHELQKRSAVACPSCGRSDLVPIDSTAGREILGDRFETTMATARTLAGEFARAAEKEREAQQRRWLRALAIGAGTVVVASACVAWAFHRQRVHEEETRAVIVERPVKPLEESDTLRQLREIEERRRAWSESGAPAKPAPKLTIAADGMALAAPRAGAEPVMRVTAGETYTLGEERGGFVRLADAPVEAWIPKP